MASISLLAKSMLVLLLLAYHSVPAAGVENEANKSVSMTAALPPSLESLQASRKSTGGHLGELRSSGAEEENTQIFLAALGKQGLEVAVAVGERDSSTFDSVTVPPTASCDWKMELWCCKVGSPCDCEKGIKVAGQCTKYSYILCCALTECQC
eukprot:TRINITY_DN48739_c0_g1_i1.p1 TRINITY_DN48739_c0_g1~~TRINITY_DN48739_c0_g1_i1.p1  ORF type:complete len:153 (-),score=19.66 TRINITY_DN48739_c0_g1_i1:288-746(-)